MADNITLNTGSGGAVLRTDDDGVAQWQYTKVAFGADNTQNIVTSTATNPLPVALSDVDNAVLDSIKSNTDSGVVVGGGVEATALRVTLASDSTGVLTVDNGGTFVVQEDGAALTALQLIDDIVAVLGTATYAEATTKGAVIGAVRNDVLATLGDTDNEIVPLQVDSRGALFVAAGNAVSANNSTTSTLGIGALYTGTGDDALGYTSVSIQIHSDVDSAVNGMTFQFSTDNSNWDDLNTYTYTAAEGARRFEFPTTGRYFRVVYTNGGTGQGHFRLQTILHYGSMPTPIHRLVDDVSPDRSAQLTKTALFAQMSGSGDFKAVQSNAAGNIKIGGSLDSIDTSVTPGVDATHLGKAEDAVHGDGDTGVAVWAVRNDVLAALAGTDGDYAPFQVNASGALYIQEGAALDVSAATVTVDNGGTFVVQEDGAALTALQLIDDPVFADDAPFTLTTSKIAVAGAIRDDVVGTLAAAEGDAVPLRVDSEGHLHVRSHLFEPGTIDGFGHLQMTEAVNQIDVQFFRDTPQNLTTVTVSGGGVASSLNGGAKWETSAGASGDAKSVSLRTTTYRSASEVYSIFTTAFTTPTDAVNENWQRHGIYDDNDGFYFSYEKTTFGVTLRNATVDARTDRSSFSDDDLTGAVGSKFTRDGVPEAADLTKTNVWRVRYGWLGSAPVQFEILSPDSRWISVHTIKPNNLTTSPHIENPDLPITIHVHKSGSDGTNLIMLSGSWGAGVTTGALPLNETLTDDTLAKVNRTVIAGKTAGGSYVNVQTTNSGNLKIALDEYDGVPTGGGVESGALRVTIANDSTGLLSVDDGGGSLTIDGTVTASNTAGDIAHDAADSGNPVKIGARAISADITALTANDRSDLLTDLVGKLLVQPYALKENFLSGTANATDTSDTAIIAAQAAGIKIYVTTIVVTNASAVDSEVLIKNGATELMRIPAPANGGATLNLAIPLVTAAATALNFASVDSVTTMYVSAVGYKGV